MMASGETEPTDLGFELHLLPIPLIHHPQRATDWDINSRAMNYEGRNVENGERKKDNEANQPISDESFRTAISPRGLPGAMISEPIEKQDDEEFREFAAASMEVSI